MKVLNDTVGAVCNQVPWVVPCDRDAVHLLQLVQKIDEPIDPGQRISQCLQHPGRPVFSIQQNVNRCHIPDNRSGLMPDQQKQSVVHP